MNSKNKKNVYIGLIIFIFIVLVALIFVFKNKSSQENKKNENNDMNNNVAKLAEESNVFGDNNKVNEVNNRIENVLENSNKPTEATKEEELASYSTNLGSSSENRLTNIRITCNKLNGVTVNNGDTFSFCDTTGPSTAEEGYKEATVFLNGEKVQALGGGNCQISSTLYNAVLTVSDLEVVERHEHGQDVSYVPEGKDAAVAHGSIDFRFKNNTGNTIKLYFSTDDETLIVKIAKIV